jgi:protein tyrosine/serine phosphatase
MRKLLSGLVPLTAALVALWLISLDRQGRLVWDHWDEVKRGVLYRSGQLTPTQLTDAIQRYNIRTVINLQWPGEEMWAERDLTSRLGVDFVNLPMPGDGLGEEWQFREILKVLDDSERRPALVHCARGTCRTGASVAFYRFERDGWTPEDVAAELRRQTYHYGLVPGYIYAMVKTKPSSTLLRSEMLFDRNHEPEQTRVSDEHREFVETKASLKEMERDRDRPTEAPRKEAVDGQ